MNSGTCQKCGDRYYGRLTWAIPGPHHCGHCGGLVVQDTKDGPVTDDRDTLGLDLDTERTPLCQMWQDDQLRKG